MLTPYSNELLSDAAGVTAGGKSGSMKLREFHTVSLPNRWAQLLLDGRGSESCPQSRTTHQALQAEIAYIWQGLVLTGHWDCWTYQL